MARTKSTKDDEAATASEPVANVTKTDAVRDAIETLGINAMPTDIQDYVFGKFGLVITPNHVSNIKSGLKNSKKKKKGKGGRPRKVVEAVAIVGEPVAAAAPRGGRGGEALVSFEDIETTKVLVRKVGSSNLHALIDLVASK